MAPKVINSSSTENFKINDRKFIKIKNKIKEYQKFIKNNFDYVGDNFAYEARSLHYDKDKKTQGIYGRATNQEIKELAEEGVEAELIPWIEDKSN